MSFRNYLESCRKLEDNYFEWERRFFRKGGKRDKLFGIAVKFGAALLLYSTPWLVNSIRNEIILDRKNEYGSEEDVKNDLEIESRKLGLDNLGLNLKFVDPEEYTAYAKRDSEGRIEIGLGRNRNRKALRHELYHIVHFDEDKSFFRCMLNISEWEATSYAVEE